jgi:hypothetical protein
LAKGRFSLLPHRQGVWKSANQISSFDRLANSTRHFNSVHRSSVKLSRIKVGILLVSGAANRGIGRDAHIHPAQHPKRVLRSTIEGERCNV